MRLWSRQIMPYLPDRQFKGQLRELVAIMHDWRDKGTTNHLLINKVMEYPKNDLTEYFANYDIEYCLRYSKPLEKQYDEFVEFGGSVYKLGESYTDWLETKEHLRIEMANLYEKHLGVGKSMITDEEWQRLLDGYKTITGEEFRI